MIQPRVCVCIFTYNQQDYIRQCVESVLAQAVDVALEILVGDDCSSDNTSAIVAQIAAANPGVVKHIRHNPRCGAAANAKTIIGLADGEFIAALDGDDFWMPGKLRKQLAYMDAHPECVGVYTNAVTVTHSGEPIGLFNDVGNQSFDLSALLRRGNFLSTSSGLVRGRLKHLLLEIDGPFIDYQVHLANALEGNLTQLAEPLVGYRVNAVGSMVANANDHVREMYWQAIMSVRRDRVSDHDFACGIADFARRVAFRALHKRRGDLLREWTPRIFGASPFGKVRTSLFIATAIVRMAWTQLYGRVKPGPFGRGVKILYRR